MKRGLAAFVVAVAVVGFTGCDADSAPTSGVAGARTRSTGSTGAAREATGSIVVSVAASLRAAFASIATAFEGARPGVEVQLNPGPSSSLSAQILEGAPADVFAAADEASIARVARAGLLDGDASVFARTTLVVVSRVSDGQRGADLSDLGRGSGIVALCASDVPCGAYADAALDAAEVRIPESRVTRERDSGATFAAVRDGDATAAIVYATEVAAAGPGLAAVPIADAPGARPSYWIGLLTGSRHRSIARDFVAFVAGPHGQALLAQHGFLSPT